MTVKAFLSTSSGFTGPCKGLCFTVVLTNRNGTFAARDLNASGKRKPQIQLLLAIRTNWYGDFFNGRTMATLMLGTSSYSTSMPLESTSTAPLLPGRFVHSTSLVCLYYCIGNKDDKNNMCWEALSSVFHNHFDEVECEERHDQNNNEAG